MAALDYLDSAEALNATFAAVAADRIPKYGPEEFNICAVVDRQSGVRQRFRRYSILALLTTVLYTLLRSSNKISARVRSYLQNLM